MKKRELELSACTDRRTLSRIVQIDGQELLLAFEKRKSLRRPLDQQVAILRTDGTLLCECTLADVSNEGARLKLMPEAGAANPDIAPKFILSLSRRGNLFRNCELIWHKNDEVGVRFIAPKAP